MAGTPAPTVSWWQETQEYLQLGYTDLLALIDSIKADLMKLLDLAQEDLPVIESVLGTVANVLTVVFPEVGIPTTYFNLALELVTNASKYVKTAEGIVTSLENAKQMNATVVGPASSDEKHAAVAAALTEMFPQAPAVVHDIAIPVAVAQLRQDGKIDMAAA